MIVREPLFLLLNQPLEEIKAIAIALQRQYPPRRSILPPQLLRLQQSPITCDPLDSCPDPSYRLQSHNLLRMQPMLVIQILKVFVKPRSYETRVEGREACQDASEQLFECEWGGWVEGVEGGGGGGVGGVQADADDTEVFFGGVVGVYKDAANFDEGFSGGVGGIGGDWVKRT